MSKVHYTLQQAMRLQPAIADMVRTIVHDVVGTFKETKGFRKVYDLVVDKTTGQTEPFEFNITGNPLDELYSGNKLEEARDLEAWRKRPVVTATTFLNGKPWAITFQQDDLDMTPEEAVKDPAIDEVAQQFMEHIVASMASSWYFHGLHDRISLWNSEGCFDAIRDHFNGMIDVMWDKNGYAVDVLVPDPSGVEPETLVLVKRNVSFNGLPQHPNPNQSEQQICQRYLDLGIISLIAFGLTEKGFSWTLN